MVLLEEPAALWGVLALLIVLCAFCYLRKFSSNLRSTPLLLNGCHPLYGSYLKQKKKYLAGYLLVAAGDWFQGPYLYALYVSDSLSSFSITCLYLLGYTSALVVGTAVGSLGDRVGRKRNSMLAAIFYIFSCVLICRGEFPLLVTGRLCGGIASSLFHSSFEAWVTSAHARAMLPPEWLAITFGDASFGNGIVAIVVGIASSVLTDRWGVRAPFLAAAACNFAALAAIWVLWASPQTTTTPISSATDITPTSPHILPRAISPALHPPPPPPPPEPAPPAADGISGALALFRAEPSIAALGLALALFEGTMYTFVYFWTPALAPNHEPLPFGLIFAAFMAAVMLGGATFSLVAASQRMPVERFAVLVYLVGTVSLLFGLFCGSSTYSVFLLFCLFEAVCGAYHATAGTLRSKVIPDRVRATVLNLFRVPLNAMVMGTMGLTFVLSTRALLLLSACLLAAGTAILQGALSCRTRLENATKNGTSSLVPPEPV
ncbi:putative molybdate-anion transporter [Paratrimastix pyriformis]|uniref:Molybdate-anion transporter n=1 Tax=Paratrimastix pyriformis TaxID=342808 RepID=A0ABQ8UCV3_9EUKA|nr:putative molybdate-anion transporter [Paratrimastix pyriformis]